MFESKKCKNCGKGLKDEWVACPYCGTSTKERPRRQYDMFQEFEKDIEREFERIDKFGPRFFKFPRVDVMPFRGGGISITIKSGTGVRPKVDVRTSGEYRKIEPQIKRKLGVREGLEETEEFKPERKPPKITEEPETKVDKTGDKQLITIKIPDVKTVENIDIRKLEQSLEVKAFAGDKAYFKLIPINPNAQILNRSFKNGVLRIELMG